MPQNSSAGGLESIFSRIHSFQHRWNIAVPNRMPQITLWLKDVGVPLSAVYRTICWQKTPSDERHRQNLRVEIVTVRTISDRRPEIVKSGL